MSTIYKTLASATLDTGVSYLRPHQDLPRTVSLDDWATACMTDLTKVSAMVISPCANLNEANDRMIATSVRLLFVINQFTHVIGIVTSKDLAGEKIVKHLQEVGGKRDEIMVRDLMTLQHKIEVMDYDELTKAKVGDLVETLKRMGRQHALVIQKSDDGHQSIRGVISTSQIGKQLGITIDTSDVAGSFAELAMR